jgi:hypothetical protein
VTAIAGVLHGTEALALGDTFERARTIELERGASLALALDDFAALRVEGPALVSLLPEGEPALLLREGTVVLDVAPRGREATTSAVWLATPVARLDVADGARLVLRAHPARASELAVVSGHVRVEGRQEGEPALLTAGGRRCLTQRGGHTYDDGRFATLEAAERALAKTSPPCAAAARTRGAALRASVAAACATVHSAEERERRLLAEHARRLAAVKALGAARERRNDARARELQGELARGAAVLHRGRERARALRAQLEALLLGRAPDPTEAALREQARAVAPYRP